ncbi:MAG TPA: type II secretion system protein, partial [Fimbriimonadaceae bacterium]|nr:type II secretion system protein [Fimbriimonadaceae bacterium]
EMRKGFTLVELLTVVGILAILAAVFFPVFKSVRAYAWQFNAAQSMKQLSQATELYLMDADGLYPLAMYWEPWTGYRTWFGVQRPEGGFDPRGGIISAYTRGRAAKDPTHNARDYMGDHSGFGYNWGFIGGDMHITGDYRWFPNCANPARAGELSDPSKTIVFATSAYRHVPWYGGQGETYDFGFIDPPYFWAGVPNVDFRHGEKMRVDAQAQQLAGKGNALVLRADGSLKPMTMAKMTDAMFVRDSGIPR